MKCDTLPPYRIQLLYQPIASIKVMLRFISLLLPLSLTLTARAQLDLKQPFKDCKLDGSITIYNHTTRRWIISDSADANKQTLPASTFKIINLLIALETGVIKDEYDIV